jgi:hypothetical protein
MLRRVALVRAPRSSETSVLTRATRRHISEEGILHSHRRENLKSYSAAPSSLILFTLIREAICSSEKSVFTLRHFTEDLPMQ